MNTQQLGEALDRLRAELADLTLQDPQRQRIEELISGIEYQLAHADDRSHGAQLRGSLADSIDQFEVEHPRLTLALNQIISALSSMGI